MQKREVGSHQGQEKEIWNVFSIFKYSKIRSLRKNNVFVFFSKAIWSHLSLGLELTVLHMTETSPFNLGVCSGGRRTPLSMQPEQPALGCLPDILAEAASADAASWWRMSVESQTDKKQE